MKTYGKGHNKAIQTKEFSEENGNGRAYMYTPEA